MNLFELQNQVTRTYSYLDYKELMQELILNSACSGREQSAEKIKFTELNAFRMSRGEKTFSPYEVLIDLLIEMPQRMTWVLIAESWCGDAAQTLPVIASLVKPFPKIELKIILRDENPTVMDEYLTKGSRSIPKLICFDNEMGLELAQWGPRPTFIEEQIKEFKELNPDYTHEEFLQNLHKWYGRDRGVSIQKDLVHTVRTCLQRYSSLSLQSEIIG